MPVARPVTIPMSSPALCACQSPELSRTWNVAACVPSVRQWIRPSVSTPSMSSTRAFVRANAC
jgi:hypothetical protein